MKIFSFLNNRWVYNLVLSLCVLTLLVSSFRIVEWNAENRSNAAILGNVQDRPQDEVALDAGDVFNAFDLDELIAYQPRFHRVDVRSLLTYNDHTVCWLRVNGTNIDHPVVQNPYDQGRTETDYFYLTHDFLRQPNSAGWVFADPRNNFDNFEDNRHVIFYGHNRLDGSMFNSLFWLEHEWWQNDPSNFFMTVTTMDTMYIYRIFSVMRTSTAHNYTRTRFSSDEDFVDFIVNELQANNILPVLNENGRVFTGVDQIITLSTCVAYDERRFTASAYLVASQPL